VKIEVFATVASHHGTARATIDAGTIYTINYKATQRAEQVLVWSSPVAQPGAHPQGHRGGHGRGHSRPV
jgi:mannan endo-1,4-beta-mannosidase